MKRIYRILFLTACLLSLPLTSCRESFLERDALGATQESTLANKAGVEGLLVGAYSLLDGQGGPNGEAFNLAMAVHNWVFGSVASDEAHKGSELGDQPDQASIENYTSVPTNFYFNDKWRAVYAGVQRANDVLRLLAKVTDGSITPAQQTQLTAEARFLRGVYHLEAAKLWRNIPYVDETVSYANGNYNVSNAEPVWPKIEADFQFAADNLTPTKSEVGRANSWAAKAFLAKVYLFQRKFAEAKPLLEDIIANGVTAAGQKFDLVNFADNFNPSKKNSPESVFAVQMSVNDGSGGQNGNYGLVLAMPNGGPTACCSFFQPSFDLVNSYRTDPLTGLPLLATFNESPVTNDQGLTSQNPFTPYAGTLDPRLDWTVGRRGIPYLDWGLMPGSAWIRSQASGGPYILIKNVYYRADAEETSEAGWSNFNSNNYTMIRFADVLLWAAEVEVEIGSLDQAEAYVNRVRARAANPAGWVKTYVDNNDPSKGFTNQPAANYKIGLYNGEFSRQGQSFAREAVRFERKLELAMEGHRFFDLQRYDTGQPGYMASVLNAYIAYENQIPGFNYQYMNGAKFTPGKNEIYPVPQAQIDLSKKDGASLLQQNPGY
jgi:hypothetical protein